MPVPPGEPDNPPAAAPSSSALWLMRWLWSPDAVRGNGSASGTETETARAPLARSRLYRRRRARRGAVAAWDIHAVSVRRAAATGDDDPSPARANPQTYPVCSERARAPFALFRKEHPRPTHLGSRRDCVVACASAASQAPAPETQSCRCSQRAGRRSRASVEERSTSQKCRHRTSASA